MESSKNSLVLQRNTGLDIIKFLAAIFVILLHVNGYVLELQDGFSNYSKCSEYLYYILQAISYPAIHLFVLAGSHLMIVKGAKISRGIDLYIKTYAITIIGLVVSIVLFYGQFGIFGVIQCIVPFFGRAYWFITDYLILMALSPFLNLLIKKLKNYQLLVLTLVLLVIECILPTFLGSIAWDQNYSNIGLFILLYFIAATIRTVETNRTPMMKKGAFLYIISLALLVGSCFAIHFFAGKVPALQGREMYFYQYWSVFVVGEAVGLYTFFINWRGKLPIALNKVVITISGATLFIYECHMHPILKTLYTPNAVFSYIRVDNTLYYVASLIITVVIIMVCGIVLSKLLSTVLKPIITKANQSIQNKLIKWRNKCDRT